MAKGIHRTIMQDPENNNCFVCGAWASDTHHIFGASNRNLSDEDGMTVRLCRNCHRQIHDEGTGMRQLRITGQRRWEEVHGTREEFRARYGKSYL